jgi:hypothetical protein
MIEILLNALVKIGGFRPPLPGNETPHPYVDLDIDP